MYIIQNSGKTIDTFSSHNFPENKIEYIKLFGKYRIYSVNCEILIDYLFIDLSGNW